MVDTADTTITIMVTITNSRGHPRDCRPEMKNRPKFGPVFLLAKDGIKPLTASACPWRCGGCVNYMGERRGSLS